MSQTDLKADKVYARTYLDQVFLLVKRLLICYLLYFVSRLVFYFANKSSFNDTGLGDLLSDCFFGLRFDSFSIVVSNSLFILLSLLPFSFFYHRIYQVLLGWLFLLTNFIFIALNFIDVAYFPFIKKRSTSDLFAQLGGQSDMGKLIPQFAKDFWWVILLFIVSVYFLNLFYKRIKIKIPLTKPIGNYKQYLLVALMFCLCIGLSVLAVRGGLQRVPIDLVNAGAVTRNEGVPIVLNTPFSIIKSMEHEKLKPREFFSAQELKAVFNPIHHYNEANFKPQNVVVIILESFAKEYTGLGGKKSLTPFLDSLMQSSLVFTNGFSNGTKSIEGIPAILSSMPSVMQNPVINSEYGSNRQTSIASLLKAEGYTTAFFHGGINGTMNFDDWAPAAGYQKYYGRNEYNNDDDFDGFWGIFDEPFLQYTVSKLSEFKQPFHSAIFTLSSHHPYLVPEKYKGRFPSEPYENSASIGYADYSLKRFFESAKKTTWYANTLFVLTADHCSLSGDPFFSNEIGYLTIPVLFYKPDNSLKGKIDRTLSQIDILPSVMQLLGYNKPFFSFGKSFKEEGRANACFYSEGKIYLYGDSLAYCFINDSLQRVYNYRRDSIMNINIRGQQPSLDSSFVKQYKAFMQTYSQALNQNSAYVK